MQLVTVGGPEGATINISIATQYEGHGGLSCSVCDGRGPEGATIIYI